MCLGRARKQTHLRPAFMRDGSVAVVVLEDRERDRTPAGSRLGKAAAAMLAPARHAAGWLADLGVAAGAGQLSLQRREGLDYLRCLEGPVAAADGDLTQDADV